MSKRLVATLSAVMLCLTAFVVAGMRLATAASCPPPGLVGAICPSVQPGDPEPQVPIWQASTPSSPQLTGASDGFGGWIDTMENTISGNSPAHLNSGEIGYNAYESIGGCGPSQHWEANGYFVADLSKTCGEQGTDLSPQQSFTFQNGKLVLEGDVTASEPGFVDSSGGDIAWPEIAFSTTPSPVSNSNTNDGLYLYGHFKGAWASGCRLQAKRSETCAVEADHDLSSTTGDQPPCWSAPPARVMELSGFQYCGSTHTGFDTAFGSPGNAWRTCVAGQVDACLDRFRIEWTQSSITLYVNGIKFGEDSGWPAASQFPASVVNGSTPVYAHFGEWGDFSDSNVYRFHWGRVAVNPHLADGTPAPPSASPTFGAPTPTPSSTPTSTPTATPSSTPTPTATPTATPSSTPSPSPTASGFLVGDQKVESTVDSNDPGTAQAFGYTATAGGTVGHLALYVDPSNAAKSIGLGLYSDSGGAPGALLTGGTLSNPSSGWSVLSVPAATVVAGQKYWLAILGPAGAGDVEFRDVTSGGASPVSSQTNLTALPSSWTNGIVWGSAPASVYATS